MAFRNAILPAVAIVMSACAAAPEAAAENQALRTITVTGEGKTTAAPDMAILNIGVQSNAETAAAALRENSSAMTATINKLKDLGVAEKDIQTSGLSIRPQYDYERNRTKPLVIGYTASNNVTVKLRDLDDAGRVIDQAVQTGANSLGGISFTFADPKPLYEAARKDAVAVARARAELLTEAAGVNLGQVLTIQDGYAVTPSPVVQVAAMRTEADMAVPVQAGESTISANVTIVYEIR